MTMEMHGVIAAQSVVRGDIDFAGGLWLDGVVEGTLKGHPLPGSHLVVSPRGSVRGDVEAESLVIHGQVQGNIRAGKVRVLSTARITGGLLTYDSIEIEEGAVISAEMRHHNAAQEAGAAAGSAAASTAAA